MKNIAVFASGKGSNFLAINDAIQKGLLDANICLFVTDKVHSEGLKKAKELHINTFSFSAQNYNSKEGYENDIIIELEKHRIDLIVLAGYMRIIGRTILEMYPNKIINIHPSLLPLFRGKDAIGQAMQAKATKTGVTVHFVDEDIDTGKIVMQKEVSIDSNDNRDSLELKIHKVEHDLYYKAIKRILEDQI